VIIIPIDGASNAPVKDQTETEENTIDVSMIGACCATPSLTIILFISPNSLSQFPNLLTKASSSLTIDGVVYTPSVISISWGAAEIYYTQDQLNTINAILKNLSANGINICVASGDNGSSDGVPGNMNYVDFPASSPYVTGCGGTTLTCPTLNYADSTTIEIAWTSGGGGVSANFFKPSWQTPFPGAVGPYRAVPDVALVANPSTGVEFIVGGSNVIYGGTSIVSPAMAAYYACLNTNTFLLPSLYAASLSSKNSFNDILVGSNGSYNASVGYDSCTGLGSIAGNILSPILTNAPPIVIKVTGITLDTYSKRVPLGQQIRIVAVVAPSNASDKSIVWTSSDNTIASVVALSCPLRGSCSKAPSRLVLTTPPAPLGADSLNELLDTPLSPDPQNMNLEYQIQVFTSCECGCATGDACTCANPSCCISNNAIGPCDSIGLITGLTSGSAIITATTVDGEYSVFASINVVNTSIIPVTGISLNVRYITLIVGAETQLIATITPPNATNTAVTWSSTSSSTTVSNTGLVKAISAGSSSIIVKSVDGEFTARTLVTVTKPLLTMRFYSSSITLFSYTSYQTYLIFDPPNVRHSKVIYTSSSPNIATVNSSGVINALRPGTTVIQATVIGATALLNVTVLDYYTYFLKPLPIPPMKIKSKSLYNSYKNIPITMRR